MKTLLAFDTDGTFVTKEDFVSGMIDPKKLYDKTHETWNTSNIIGVAVVSESIHFPRHENNKPMFELINNLGSRFENLVSVKKQFEIRNGRPDLCLYVDDQAIYKKDAEKAGFIFVDANLFADMFGVRK